MAAVRLVGWLDTPTAFLEIPRMAQLLPMLETQKKYQAFAPLGA